LCCGAAPLCSLKQLRCGVAPQRYRTMCLRPKSILQKLLTFMSKGIWCSLLVNSNISTNTLYNRRGFIQDLLVQISGLVLLIQSPHKEE
jgi:hypothetical protein